MIDIMKLRREQQKIKDEMRKLCNDALARDDKRMSEQEGAKYQELEAQVRNFDQQIELAERSNALELENGHKPAGKADDSEGTRGGFKGFGEFLQAVRAACVPGGRTDDRLQHETRAASGHNEAIPSDGGFLVQTDHLTEIMKRTYDKALIAGRCRRVPIGANANGLSWLEIDETSRAAGSRWGGVRGYWAAEAATVTASKTKFMKKRLDLEKLMSLVYVTDELLQDTTGLEALASGLVGDEFAWLLDNAIVNGNGAGQPLGWLNSDCLVSVSKEAGQSAATIVYENIVKMRARLWAASRGNSVWYINQDCEPQLHTMAFVVGTGGVPVYLPTGGVSATPYDTLYGRPVVPIEQAATCGTIGDIILADPSQYLLIDKGGVNSAVSIHVRFLYDEQVFRFTYRINGMPTWNSVLTPANGASNTVSPFVALATRA
jgi:HK97 family phage major capsid protein